MFEQRLDTNDETQFNDYVYYKFMHYASTDKLEKTSHVFTTVVFLRGGEVEVQKQETILENCCDTLMLF